MSQSGVNIKKLQGSGLQRRRGAKQNKCSNKKKKGSRRRKSGSRDRRAKKRKKGRKENKKYYKKENGTTAYCLAFWRRRCSVLCPRLIVQCGIWSCQKKGKNTNVGGRRPPHTSSVSFLTKWERQYCDLMIYVSQTSSVAVVFSPTSPMSWQYRDWNRNRIPSQSP